jgi:hypothetical protein
MRYRITVRGEGIELRGYIDNDELVADIAHTVDSYGAMVVMSPAPQDYDPFDTPPKGQE